MVVCGYKARDIKVDTKCLTSEGPFSGYCRDSIEASLPDAVVA